MPNLFVDVATKAQRMIKRVIDTNLQGVRDTEGHVTLKVINGPYISTDASHVAASTVTLLPAKKGVRYFIHTVNRCYIDDGTPGTHSIYSIRNDASTQVLMKKTVAAPDAMSVVQAYTLDVLLDANAGVFSNNSAAATCNDIVITYKEISE